MIVDNFSPAFKKKLKNAIREMSKKKTLNLISKRIAEYTRAQAANYGTGKKYAPLKRSTVKYRKYIAKKTRTHKSYKAEKANLTITGQLLDSINTRATGSGSAIKFIINVKGMHKKYTGSKGKKIGKNVPNKTIRKGLAKINRDPIQDGKKIRIDLLKLFRKAVSKALK